MNLQEWTKANAPTKEMLWHDAFWHQVNFVDMLARTFGCEASVVGSHRSKSINCPVYKLDLGGAELVMRYNFFNWNVAVKSRAPVCFSVDKLIHPDNGDCFCEGMEDMQDLPAYAPNSTAFLFSCSTTHQLYTVAYLLWESTNGHAVKAGKKVAV